MTDNNLLLIRECVQSTLPGSGSGKDLHDQLRRMGHELLTSRSRIRFRSYNGTLPPHSPAKWNKKQKRFYQYGHQLLSSTEQNANYSFTES